MVLAPLAAYLQFGDGWWSSVWAICGWMVFVSMLIVSQIPTAAMKSVSVPPRMVVLLLALVTVAAALLLQYPYVLLLVLIVVYLTHIPFAWRSQRWVAARPESWDAKPKSAGICVVISGATSAAPSGRQHFPSGAPPSAWACAAPADRARTA